MNLKDNQIKSRFSFPVTLTTDEVDGGFTVTFRDLPEAITQGENMMLKRMVTEARQTQFIMQDKMERIMKAQTLQSNNAMMMGGMNKKIMEINFKSLDLTV